MFVISLARWECEHFQSVILNKERRAFPSTQRFRATLHIPGLTSVQSSVYLHRSRFRHALMTFPFRVFAFSEDDIKHITFPTMRQDLRYAPFKFRVAALTLRTRYHVLGALVGTLPKMPLQNTFFGLPVLLMDEEVTVLLRNGLIKPAASPGVTAYPRRRIYRRWRQSEKKR
ncbi:uncharacterized protein EV422DRAFT_199250 [Fimicolochytrium jonesii]|uniref:uncharacterized protein n=1 Tax=Fimicolochytrium jonesii TaxID=1396493 RepID=UPI0022FE2D8E|nr:uncharacterized protein EV422DRAFT_199250 [Fimicolochytrium jonesii]KAI8817937.1 hypothetical protein EV422DRAFT_199250 [Fimicolochytrium jonesii]